MQRLCNIGWRQAIRRFSSHTDAEHKSGLYKKKILHENYTTDLICRVLNSDVSSQSHRQISVAKGVSASLSTVHHHLATYFKQYNSDKKDDRFEKGFLDDLWFTGVIAIYGGILSHSYFYKEEDICPFKIQNKDALLQLLTRDVYSDHFVFAVNSKNSTIPNTITEDSSDVKIQISLEKFNEAVATFEEVSNECYGSLLNKYALEYRKTNQYKEAFELFQNAATYGYTPSIYNLGLCYEYGHGVKTSLRKAAEYYNQAAEKGHVKSMFNIATFHYEGNGCLPDENRDVGLLYMKKAADGGLAKAQSFVALQFSQDDNWSEAFKYFKIAADQKDRVSVYNLAVCYENGFGVTRDVKQAMEYYRQSGEMGDALSQFYLGDSYEHGLRGMAKDLKEALKWYKLALANGHRDAKTRVDYLEDIVEKDEPQKKLAENKYILSFLNLSKSLVMTKYKGSVLLPLIRRDWTDVDRIIPSGV